LDQPTECAVSARASGAEQDAGHRTVQVIGWSAVDALPDRTGAVATLERERRDQQVRQAVQKIEAHARELSSPASSLMCLPPFVQQGRTVAYGLSRFPLCEFRRFQRDEDAFATNIDRREPGLC